MTQIITHTEFPFPEDLEGRLNAITNIINSELKSATLLHLDDTLAEGSDILARIRQSVGKGVRLGCGGINFSQYCHKSLLPIGTVAEEEIRRETDGEVYLGYRITEAGKKYGIPLAVFSLGWAVDNNLSLYSILGITNSKGKSRSPLNRVKILELLRKQGALREVDLAQWLRLREGNVEGHLNALQEVGFVQYASIPEMYAARGMFNYQYTGKQGESEAIGRSKPLTSKVLECVKKLKIADRNRIAEELDSPITRISAVLSGLEQQGFLQREGYFKGGEILSKAEITDLGRKFVDEYIAIVEDSLSNGSSLSELQEEANRFSENPERARDYLSRGINNYWRVSPQGNSKPKEETYERIIVYLQKNPGARPKDIEEHLRLSRSQTYLKPLLDSGVLEKRKIDSKNKLAVGYFVVGQGEN